MIPEGLGYVEHVAYPTHRCALQHIYCTQLRVTLPFLMCALTNIQDDNANGGSTSLPGIVLIKPLQMTMDDIIVRCCGESVSVLYEPLATEIGGVWWKKCLLQ